MKKETYSISFETAALIYQQQLQKRIKQNLNQVLHEK